MRTLSLAGALLALLALSGCQSKEQKEANQAELDKLAGVWKVSDHVAGAKGLYGEEDFDDEAPAKGATVVIDREKGLLIHQVQGAAVRWQKITLDAGKDPHHIDLLEANEDGSRMTTRATKRTGVLRKRRTTTTEYRQIGVYKLDGGTLTITLSNVNDKKRPALVGEKGVATLILKKDKKED